MAGVFSFPRTVNEKAARVVAFFVFLIALTILATGALWLLAVLCAGFVLRVLAGPSLSPLALFATRVAAPRLGPPQEVPGPPKRFAQALGAVMTTAAAVAALGFGATTVASILVGAMIVAAGLEAVFAFCLGCKIFAALMRAGVVPDEICADCAYIWARAGAR